MEETIHRIDQWENTITKIFKLGPKYKLDHLIRQWVIYNKMEDFNFWPNYTDEDFKPYGCGNLSYYKESDSLVKMMSITPMQMLGTSVGIFNISLMKVDIYMMMMNPIIF